MPRSLCFVLILVGFVAGCSSSGNIIDLSSRAIETPVETPGGSAASITYSDPASYFIKGTAISSISPLTLTGSPKSLSISPSLPAGLSFNTQ